MPVETWFPTVVFYEDLQLDPAVKQRVLDAVRERVDAQAVRDKGYVTANNARNDLHLDSRVAALFDVFRPFLQNFLFGEMLFDPLRVEFHVGRCWPVVQVDNGYEGMMHHHRGAVFSGVFYLQSPPGSGALEFYKPTHSPYDGLPKARSCGLTYPSATYQAVENRLLLFSADLMHRRLANTAGSPEQRIAVAFDLYAMADIGAYSAGLPRAEYLKKLL
jgi:uncharacterized protein (TIGR02466 family)